MCVGTITNGARPANDDSISISSSFTWIPNGYRYPHSFFIMYAITRITHSFCTATIVFRMSRTCRRRSTRDSPICRATEITLREPRTPSRIASRSSADGTDAGVDHAHIMSGAYDQNIDPSHDSAAPARVATYAVASLMSTVLPLPDCGPDESRVGDPAGLDDDDDAGFCGRETNRGAGRYVGVAFGGVDDGGADSEDEAGPGMSTVGADFDLALEVEAEDDDDSFFFFFLRRGVVTVGFTFVRSNAVASSK